MCASKIYSNQNKVNLIPTGNKKRFRIQLSLPTETRYIGFLDTSGEGSYVTERKKKHIYRKFNSFGVSYDLIHNPNIEFRWIIIRCDGKEYLSTRDYFRVNGKVSNFTSKGFELQLHIPIAELNIEAVKQFEKSYPIQLNFFQEEEGRNYANA
jgi:hypothetical protein